jgi:hypothetical protein
MTLLSGSLAITAELRFRYEPVMNRNVSLAWVGRAGIGGDGPVGRVAGRWLRLEKRGSVGYRVGGAAAEPLGRGSGILA